MGQVVSPYSLLVFPCWVHVNEFFFFISFVLVDSDSDSNSDFNFDDIDIDVDIDDWDGEWVLQFQHLRVLALGRNENRKVRGIRYFHRQWVLLGDLFLPEQQECGGQCFVCFAILARKVTLWELFLHWLLSMGKRGTRFPPILTGLWVVGPTPSKIAIASVAEPRWAQSVPRNTLNWGKRKTIY